jgi:2-phospho-L-lactate transferase/gluconeogenesis factor (CofD/UPF0052 family)
VLNLVILNGGRGAASTISALLAKEGVHITSIVNAYDDGKSTGEIRRMFGMLGPSDVRKVQELMLPRDDPDYEANLHIFRYRFQPTTTHTEAATLLHEFASEKRRDLAGVYFTNTKVDRTLRTIISEFLKGIHTIQKVRGTLFDFSDCSLMNCIYAGTFLLHRRNFESATIYIDRLFKLRGTVLPTSIEDKQLVAIREDGEVLYSEADVVELRSNARIKRIYLLDKPLDRSRFSKLELEEKEYYLSSHHSFSQTSRSVISAIKNADIIIYAAGTQHSSLYPTYLASGLAESIADNRTSLKVFVTNIGADYETPTYKASDYVIGAHKYLSSASSRSYRMDELFNVILINQSHFKPDQTYVELDYQALDAIPVRKIIDTYESPDSPGQHDGPKIAKTIFDLYDRFNNLTENYGS